MQHFASPHWLHLTAIVSLAVAVLCATWIVVDEVRKPQRMWIMNLVWPLTALFGSVLWIWLYVRSRQASKVPPAIDIAKATTHCGAGCVLGDIIAEWLAFIAPAVAIVAGWHSLFAEKMFAVWVLDFALAFSIGIAFQYFTITPMRNLSVREGLFQALKADAASIVAWQLGMYGFMAFAQFGVFKPLYGALAPVNSVEFWFAMQVAMLCGFVTSYPANWLLLRAGVKERM